MPRRFVVEYVAKHLCGARVLESLVENNAATGVIGTHNGSFHCDEAMACGLLRCSPNFANSNILRSRDPRALEQCHIVVDVGGVYDAAALRFDHHQPSFHGTMTTPKATYHTRLSSAGLVYKHFGREIIQSYVVSALASPYRDKLLEAANWGADREQLSEQELDTLFDIIYKNFVEHIDGIDNGVDAYGTAEKEGEEGATSVSASSCVRRYTVSTTLSDRIGRLLPWWNEDENGRVESENAAFLQAVELAAREFFDAVHYHAFAWLPARRIVEEAFLAAMNVHPSGRIVVFKDRFCPWKDHLMELEAEHGKVGHVLYVLFSDKKNWRVQAVPTVASGFGSRKPLPWRGMRDEELSQASGIDGGIFVHVSGFIGGNKTYGGALQMAVKALTTVE
ncbi:metal binding protein [Trypanosoma rangeli]|uniref:Metal binding protein n=1 Tax=Trypanosoma rangeli TaxID=5698 RepID=A0A422N2F9_TRYRA|nr:metal binding protein [Trypanosoma rangeli]RNE99656.1 metal binding protein [Trypanosoma rangeli]|eukprot:RNE99656.1 metal binding protein [Trypanosoma rangeli]